MTRGRPRPGHYPKDGTLSPRQLAAFLSPRKTALRREQRQRHSSFLFRFRLFGLFSFPVGSSLPFRHNTVPYVVIQEVKPTLIPYGGDFKFCSANPNKVSYKRPRLCSVAPPDSLAEGSGIRTLGPRWEKLRFTRLPRLTASRFF